METSQILDSFSTRERGTLGFELRVRGSKYLWGSAGLKQDAVFSVPPVLHLQNDPYGEKIELSLATADGGRTDLGSLAPGECLSVEIQNMTGVIAHCGAESLVRCALK